MSSLFESTVPFVDLCLARSGYHGRSWSDQLSREFLQRHQERSQLARAKEILALVQGEGGTPCQQK